MSNQVQAVIIERIGPQGPPGVISPTEPHFVLAGPDVGSTTALPGFRLLVQSDLSAITNLTFIDTPNIFTSVISLFGGIRVGTKVLTADYAPTAFDFAMFGDATAASFNIQLPAAIDSGQVYYFKKIDSTVNVVTIVAGGSDLINGAASVALTEQWADTLIIDAGAAFWASVNLG